MTFGRKNTTAGGKTGYGRKALALAVAAAGLAPLGDRAGAAVPGATVRVSVSSSGGQLSESGIPLPSISADGRYVAFGTRGTGLVPNDTNARDDIFVHDRTTGETTRVSVGPGGRQANGGSFFPDISADGRFVVFGSGASDLVAGDDNEDPTSPTASIEAVGRDVFVHDRQTGVTERVSVASDGTQGRCFSATTGEPSPCPGGVALADASINADGRYVAFAGRAENLVPGDTNAQPDVFVHDRQTRQTTRISVGPNGVQATGGESIDPSISADGRYVAFRSNATNLVPGDTNLVRDIFVHDRQTGTTERVSVASDGAQAVGGGGSVLPQISADGRYVTFTSGSTNLVPGDNNGTSDVFVHDRTTGETARVSVGLNGAEPNGASSASAFGGGGRFVAYDSIASNLVAGDTNGASDVFVYDRETGTTTRASITASGSQAFGGGSFFPVMSLDGRSVAFSSESSSLTPGDTNNAPDVFVHDRTLPAPAATGYRLAAADGGIFAFGDARFFGSTGGTRLAQPITASATTPNGRGYWLAAQDGGVFAFGAAGFFGSAAPRRPAAPIVAMAPTVGGQGYWLAGADGRVYDFGDAVLRSPAAGLRLAAPIVGMAVTPSGNGYWLVAADGGVFGFGDARFFGSTGNIRLARPIVGMAPTPNGNGYWLVAADGGVFAFGDARFFGSTGAIRLAQPVVGMAANLSGAGYWLVARDGGVFAFGDARFFGSTGAIRLNQPVVALTPA